MPPQGYEYVLCKSSQSVQWSGNFTGQLPFTFKTPNLKWCKPRECYLVVKLRVGQREGALNSTPLKPFSDDNGNFTRYPYISKNPVSAPFTGKVLVHDELIINMNELSATKTLIKTIYNTRSMQDTIESIISSIVVTAYQPVINNASTTAPVLTAGTTING